jgi:hypothetical protein
VSGEKYGLSFGGSVAAKIMAKYGFKVRGSELGHLNLQIRLKSKPLLLASIDTAWFGVLIFYVGRL